MRCPIRRWTGAQEPGGSRADGDCAGEVSGSGSPYTVVLASGQSYWLTVVDNWWFGPDGLPPVSANVVIEGNGAVIERWSGSRSPFRFFYVSGGLSGLPRGSLALRDVSLQGGVARGGDGGGGGAGMGGAVFDQGALTLQRMTISASSAQGGSQIPAGGGGIGESGDRDRTGVGSGVRRRGRSAARAFDRRGRRRASEQRTPDPGRRAAVWVGLGAAAGDGGDGGFGPGGLDPGGSFGFGGVGSDDGNGHRRRRGRSRRRRR